MTSFNFSDLISHDRQPALYASKVTERATSHAGRLLAVAISCFPSSGTSALHGPCFGKRQTYALDLLSGWAERTANRPKSAACTTTSSADSSTSAPPFSPPAPAAPVSATSAIGLKRRCRHNWSAALVHPWGATSPSTGVVLKRGPDYQTWVATTRGSPQSSLISLDLITTSIFRLSQPGGAAAAHRSRYFGLVTNSSAAAEPFSPSPAITSGRATGREDARRSRQTRQAAHRKCSVRAL
jgi:hypothetical protein